MKRITTTVIANRPVMAETSLLVIEAPEIAAEARPGQFCMVHCGEGYFLRRPISIHHVGESVALLVRVVGRGSLFLTQRQPGDRLDIIGPLGNGYSVLPEARRLLLVAGGMGVAPLAFLAHVTLRQDRSVTMLLGARSKDQVYPSEMLPRGVNRVVVTEDGSEGRKGVATDYVAELAAEADQVFACGPVPMYKAMRQALAGKPAQVSMEAWMGCGMGACYACTTLTRQGPKQVCRDGPVFPIDDILWDKI